MSFESTLKSMIEQYTNFTVYSKSIKIPYYMTTNGVYGGKNTPAKIRSNITASVPSTASQTTIQNWVNNNKPKAGIDCSGFAYYVLNEASGGAVKAAFGDVSYENGISASSLTSTTKGYKLTRAMDVTPGCLMNTDNGNHVIVINSVTKGTNGIVNRIDYAHSNGSKGPHKGYITIGNQSDDLDSSSQTWHDTAYSDAQAKQLFNYVMRLSCLPTA